MYQRLKLITAPTVEPVSAAEAKSHLRVDTTADDTLIGTLITAARQEAEEYLNRALCTQTWDLYMDGFPASTRIKIPLPPLQSITSVKYYDEDDVEATVTSTDYIVDTVSEPGQIVLKNDKSWPSTVLRPVNGVIIRFVAGYGLAASVPQKVKQALLLQIGDMYENRENVIIGNTQVVRLRAWEDLLRKIRIMPV